MDGNGGHLVGEMAGYEGGVEERGFEGQDAGFEEGAAEGGREGSGS